MNVDEILRLLKEKKLPTAEQIMLLNESILEHFKKMPNVIDVQAPVTICGDIHGQFLDLLEIFQVCGELPYTSYLFMGDYVDRGIYSVETITYLFALKIKYPHCIHLLRGNHETMSMNVYFGFRDEIIEKFHSEELWKKFSTTFNAMPLCAVVNTKVFCVHGGLSPKIKTISDIQRLDRFNEIPREGPITDMLWSDPASIRGYKKSPRDIGYLFGIEISQSFNDTNGFELTCRAHQYVDEGLCYTHDDQVLTVFSAPDYCRRCGNKGGVVELDEHLNRRLIRFEEHHSGQPLHFPHYVDSKVSCCY